MRKIFATALVLFSTLALASFPSAGRADDVSGCGCSNMCPLAQEANKHRATGSEAVLASKIVRDDTVRIVMKNLATL